MSARNDKPARTPIVGLALIAGTLVLAFPASATLTADLSGTPHTITMAAVSLEETAANPTSATIETEAEVSGREESPKLRSSDEKPAKIGKTSKDGKPAREGRSAGKDSDDKDGSDAGKPALRADAKGASGLYQIRCWQEGRLVFEETAKSIDLAPGQYTTKFQGKDRNGASLFIADTRNATCMIKGIGEASERVPAWLR